MRSSGQQRPAATVVAMSIAMMVSTSGCMSVNFVQTDPSYRPERSERDPEVFIEAPPDRPYRAVGIIEVRGPVSRAEIVQRARVKGRELGCEILVVRALAERSASATYPPVLLAHGGPDIPQTGAPKRDAHDRQFLCGQYEPAPRHDTRPKRA